MAKLKYEFLGLYHKTNGFKLNNRFFSNVSLLSQVGTFFAPITNWLLNTSTTKILLEKFIGIDKRRNLPNFASQTLRQWFNSRSSHVQTKVTKGKVILFPDTTTNYNHPDIGIATVKVLEKLGYEVIIPDAKCCGRPMLSNGMIDGAKSNIQSNVNIIYPYVKDGSKLVGIEPSCVLGFMDDFKDLTNDRDKIDLISQNTMLIEQFLMSHVSQYGKIQFSNPPKSATAIFHGHCHQKSLVGTTSAMDVLNMIPGLDSQEIDSGCCGMAGSFGYYKKHYDVSMQIGERNLFPSIRDVDPEAVIVSEGVSCREQIEEGTGRKAKHLVELLAEYL